MKRYKCLLLTAVFLFTGYGLIADQIPGSQYFYLGNGITYFPLGAGGVSHFMSMESNLYNPAGFAGTKRITADLSVGGFAGSHTLINARSSFPTNYGIITANILSLQSPGGDTAGDVYGLKTTFSKEISDQWLFGAAVNMGFGQGPETDYYISGDIGTIYRKAVEGTGVGIFDYSIGGAVKNLGKNISYRGWDNFPPLEVDIGANAEVIRAGFYRSRLGGHFALPLNPVNTFFGFGMENIFFDTVNLKLGLNFGVEEIDWYSLGLDVNFDIQDTNIQLAYSFLPTNFGGDKQYTHNAGVSVAFGAYDKKPPEAAIEAESMYFSPNHDGVNDRAVYNMMIKDNTMVFGWKLDITDESGNPVKSFIAEDVRKIRFMTIAKYFSRILAKKEEVKIPKVIEWDGEDTEGNVVKDGTYYYTLYAWDENENRTVTTKNRIIVDNTVPMIEAKSDMRLFSPNADGVKDTLTFDIKSANIETDDEVVFQIFDRDKNVVFTKKFNGQAPGNFVWDGRDTSGALVDEGIYAFNASVADYAGNSTSTEVDGIIVRTGYERITASPEFRTFSPNNDGYFDMNDVKLFASSKEGLTEWELRVFNKDENTVRMYSGERDFPETISFDGKNEKGVVLPDGLYSMRFRVFFESGNHPESFFKFIKIDNTSPVLEVSSNIRAFSPNGDGVQDTINFVHDITAGEGDSFFAKIVNFSGATFKTFDYGVNPPGVVVWDGTGDFNRLPVEGIYTYEVTGKDSVENSYTTTLGTIKLVTGFEQISVEPSEYVFSPNDDDKKESIKFTLSTDNRDGIIEWKLDIKDSGGRIVKSFNNKNLGPDLPSEVVWDGTVEEGIKAADGVYSSVLNIRYDTGNNPIAKPKDVKLDTKSPEIEIYIDDLQISPNEDGAKETLTVYQRIRGEEDDIFKAEIKNAEGEIVRKFNWEGSVPSEIIWDGKDEEGVPLPEGFYSYAVYGEDAAGNLSGSSISEIELTTGYEEVSVVSDQIGISPNGDGYLDFVDFNTTVSSDKGLENWKFNMFNSQDQVVKTSGGLGMPPSVLTWDGKDDSGNLVPDGIYSYSIALVYRSGNHPESERGTITMDNSAPDLNFVVSPQLFSPDKDGEADTLYLNVDLNDKNGVLDWDIAIYRKWAEKIDRTAPFMTIKKQGSYRGTIRWDGYSDPLSMPSFFAPPDDITYKYVAGKWAVLVDSASSYVAEINASDTYLNRIRVVRDFDTDILVIKTPFGLKIMINSIQFEYNKWDLRPQSHSILDRLIEILEKFPNYKIKIVGHTDWDGSDEYNQELSEKRAYTVYKYLVEHDVDKERLTTEGMGETQPIDDNNTESGKARNRRVEFYLTKKQ
jgi:outer membrane protein OmpA-like peptidoglycan-associated protein/flagellar hook assembly protein FlgD